MDNQPDAGTPGLEIMKELMRALEVCLWSDLDSDEDYPKNRPLLAHYTAIATLEKIVTNNELWLSNPLYMNDYEEMRFGLFEGRRALENSHLLREICTPDGHSILCQAFENCYDEFDKAHAFDTYVMCFSKHEEDDNDGRLSMWRGYGGSGAGAALVFDTKNLNYRESTPIILARVRYLSSDDRISWIGGKIDELAGIIQKFNIPTQGLHLIARAYFERLKIFALFTKHKGFSEEEEWRVAYLPDRDHEKKLSGMLRYFIGPRGLEPKLMLPIAPIEGIISSDFSLSNLVSRVILGPTVSNPLSKLVVERMLLQSKAPELAERLVASTTPYRHQG